MASVKVEKCVFVCVLRKMWAVTRPWLSSSSRRWIVRLGPLETWKMKDCSSASSVRKICQPWALCCALSTSTGALSPLCTLHYEVSFIFHTDGMSFTSDICPVLMLCRCLDASESSAPSASHQSHPRPRVPECPICGKSFKSEKSRSVHLKRCSTNLGVKPNDLLQALRRQAAERASDNTTDQS